MTSPISESGPWSLGTLIGLPIAVAVVLVLAVLATGLIRAARSTDDEIAAEFLWPGGIVAGVVALVVAVITASPVGMYPYASEYHQWRDVTGTVDRVESRQIADGNGMSERYVFVIGGQPFSIDDTRAAVADKGDHVSLRCKREWQYAAESGWACRWAGKP